VVLGWGVMGWGWGGGGGGGAVSSGSKYGAVSVVYTRNV